MQKNLLRFFAFIFTLFFVCTIPVYAEDGYENDDYYYEDYETGEESEIDPVIIVILGTVIGGVGGTAALVFSEVKKHRPVKTAVDADAYIAAGAAKITNTEDKFLRTATTRVTQKK